MNRSRSPSLRTYQVGGFDILVGKAAADNDALTFRVAAPRDLWMHAAGYAGSHVVVRLPDGSAEPPREVVEAAAQLAAFHSKARGSRGKTDVHVCRVADVSKPRGAPPGTVRLRRWDSVKVYPRDPFPDEPERA